MNKIDYTCAIADSEREHNMLFEFWGRNIDYSIYSSLLEINTTDIDRYGDNSGYYYRNCRPSTRIQEFISVDVMPNGFVWEVHTTTKDDLVDDQNLYFIDESRTKSQLQKDISLDGEDALNITIKCIGLASNYAHYADELSMNVIEGVRCDYE